MATTGSVRVFFKKKLALDRLTIRQRQMYEIGQAGVFSVADRLRNAQGPSDGPAKPLRRTYAIWKSRKGKGNRRDLFFTGQMLRSLKVRTVNDNRVYSSVGADARTEKRLIAVKTGKKAGSTRKLTNKDVAWLNQKREPWLVFSPVNRRVIIEKIKQVLGQIKDQLVKVN